MARVFRPVVLLPAALLGRLSEPQMNAVLAHELEHIERRDNLKANVHRLVETLFWFHPAVWWIGRQMLEERERACDERVLDNGHDGAEYAAGILEVCRHCRAGAFVSAAATSGDLTRRVRYILGNARPRSLGVIKAMVAAVCDCWHHGRAAVRRRRRGRRAPAGAVRRQFARARIGGIFDRVPP